MPVVKRGSSYQATINHQGTRYRRQFNSDSEARAWEMEGKAALLRGNTPVMSDKASSGSQMTLMDLLSETYNRHWKGAKAAHTAVTNARTCVTTLGNLPVAHVSSDAIDAAIDLWKAGGSSNGTINRRLSALSKMLHHAHDRGYIQSLPKLTRAKEHQGRVRFLTAEEEQSVLGYLRLICREDMRDLVTVAMDTGMRRGELLRLKWEDVDNNTIRVWETKNGKPRSIPMTKRVAVILKLRFNSNPQQDMLRRLVFPLTEDAVRVTWDRVRAFMGFSDDPHFVFHMLRHTFISRLVQRGVSLRVVADLAGHTSITTTMRYAHLAPQNLTDAINLLEMPHATGCGGEAHSDPVPGEAVL